MRPLGQNVSVVRGGRRALVGNLSEGYMLHFADCLGLAILLNSYRVCRLPNFKPRGVGM